MPTVVAFRTLSAALHPLPLVALALLAAPLGSADAQGLPADRQGEYGCTVDAATPCRGRLDFERGRSFEFKIAGKGTALVSNEGNRRCTLEYSLTGASIATAGRRMDIGPSGTFELPVADAGGLVLRFFDRGAGSSTCDLMVTLRG